MTKPLYFYNGTTFELVGPTTPQSPIAYQTSAPTAPATGDLWIDSDGDVDTYNRQLTRYYFVATAGQTSLSGVDANGLTLAYVAGSEAVYVNGALQVRGQDYTATNGTSITGLSALALNDVVEIFAYTAFTVANTYTQSQIDALIGGTGSLSGAWTSYTPTITGASLGNGTLDAKYKQIGKTVFVRFKFTLGSTSSINGCTITKPITSVTPPSASAIAPCALRDTGVAAYIGIVAEADTTTFYIANLKVDTTYPTYPAITSTTPFTWGSGDEISFTCIYEAA